MRKYVLDTNIYIQASHDDAMAEALERFVAAFMPNLYLHAVVAFELLLGAQTPERQKRMHKVYVEPFERRGRIITPGASAWRRAGEALGELLGSRKVSPGSGITRSFVNDSLIAASATQSGFVLITENVKDFKLLSTVLPIEYSLPWPEIEKA